jgi:hypothetical protein
VRSSQKYTVIGLTLLWLTVIVGIVAIWLIPGWTLAGHLGLTCAPLLLSGIAAVCTANELRLKGH